MKETATATETRNQETSMTATATRPSRRAMRSGHFGRYEIRTMRRLAATSGRLAALRWTRAALRAIANPRAAQDGDFTVARDLVNLWC